MCAVFMCCGVNCGDIFASVGSTAPGPAAARPTTAGRATRHDVKLVHQDFASRGGEGGATSADRDQAPTIVIGFVGGFVRHNNAVHSPVQIAARLRSAYPSSVYVEVFENHRREDAYRRILELLDATHAGTLSAAKKRDARVIIYGMSWGGSETVTLARELENQKIPVLLTIQVDSVAKLGQNDEVIPTNVIEAANFYQTNGLLHGRSRIRAKDAARTRILGNFRYDYKTESLSCKGYPWYDRVLTKFHTEIECDSAVWNRVEALIRADLPGGVNDSTR